MTVTVTLNNNAVSRLASSLSSGATSLSVSTGEGAKYPAPTGGQWFPLTLLDSAGALEIVRCTGRSGDVLTISRAQEGTAAQAFVAGDRVELRLTAAALNESFASLQADSATAAAFFIFRNKLINPKGTINQRVYVSGTATIAANQYTLDRWRVVTSGQSLSWTTSGNRFLMTAPAGGVEQVIEGTNIEGGTYRLSWTGTATAKVNGTAITNGALTASLTAGSDVTVTFANGTFEKPQFELNNVTPFEERFVGLELILCQRYYEQVDFLFNGYAPTASYIGGTVQYRVQKRASPTLTLLQDGVRVANSNVGVLGFDTNTESLHVFRQVAGTGGAVFHVRYAVSAEL
jgi:hypothetical protein